jgi:hypothetical protein
MRRAPFDARGDCGATENYPRRAIPVTSDTVKFKSGVAAVEAESFGEPDP